MYKSILLFLIIGAVVSGPIATSEDKDTAGDDVVDQNDEKDTAGDDVVSQDDEKDTAGDDVVSQDDEDKALDDVVFQDAGVSRTDDLHSGSMGPTNDWGTTVPTMATTKYNHYRRYALSPTIERFVAKLCVLAKETFGVELCPVNSSDRGYGSTFDDGK